MIESLWFGCHYPSILMSMQTSLINCKYSLSLSRQQLLFPDIKSQGSQNSSKHCSTLTLICSTWRTSLDHWKFFISESAIQEVFLVATPLHFPFKIPALINWASQSLLGDAVFFFLFLKIYLFLCIWVFCLHVYMYNTHRCQKRTCDTWNWSYKPLWTLCGC